MKKTWLLVLAGMLFFTGMAFSQGTPIVAEWVIYDDHEPPNNGDSKITMTQVTMDGQPAYRFTGNTTTKYQYGFTGWTAKPDAAGMALIKTLKPTSTLTFKVRGDGKRYTVKLRSNKVMDYAVHEFHFPTTAGQTTTVTVQFRQFMQPSWGQSVRLNPADIEDIQWQTHESWRPGSYDVTVWDLRINP